MDFFKIEQKFEINFEEKIVKVQSKMIAGNTMVYVCHFADHDPIIVTRAKDFARAYFWTCLPENKLRQPLAEKVGEVIEEFIKKQAKGHVLF